VEGRVGTGAKTNVLTFFAEEEEEPVGEAKGETVGT
jgi:hypothetical protein